jgi:hypothetical protein
LRQYKAGQIASKQEGGFKMSKRLVIVTLLAALAVALMPTGAALADGLPTDPIITVSQCTLSVEFDAQVPGYYEVRIWDNGKITHSQSLAGAYFGDTLIFEFAVLDLAPSGATGVGVEIVKGSSLYYREVPAIQDSCYGSLANGCSPSLNDNAVVGMITETTPAYFEPSSDAATTTILEAGKTWWVLGTDASGSWYQVAVSCQAVWVPASAMGPNFDAVWNGRPLPSNVVK